MHGASQTRRDVMTRSMTAPGQINAILFIQKPGFFKARTKVIINLEKDPVFCGIRDKQMMMFFEIHCWTPLAQESSIEIYFMGSVLSSCLQRSLGH